MAIISIIAAIGKNNELGKNNDLIWHLKEDLKFFKETTMNHKIVMGYNTFKSLPKLLPGREHIVLTHKDIEINGVTVFNNIEDLITYLNKLDEVVYIIGGGMIYNLFINQADELILTEIDAEYLEADTYFPKFDRKKYIGKIVKEHDDNGIKYKHIKYSKNPIFSASYEEYCRNVNEIESNCLKKVKKYNK